MKTETILDAMAEAKYERWASQGEFDHERRVRQYHTFRARILRMDADKNIALDAVTIHVGRLQKEILEKDIRIAGLEKLKKSHGFHIGMIEEWNTPEEDEAWKDL